MNTEPEQGGWFVDERCTNCDVARQLAPDLIGVRDGRSVVLRQPRGQAETGRLLAAAHACHTRSIRSSAPLSPAGDPYPLALDDAVLLCGHNSRRTAGANSYLLRRPDGGTMMVDTPRWSPLLADRYAALGPVTDVLLTHRDHAAHGRRYADRFGARLWIHEGDLAAAPDADRVLRGTGPTAVGPGVTAVPLPGHTLGSVLYLADDRYCFSGDSLYWSRTTADVEVFDTVAWYSIEELATSLARTADQLRFEWLLPGHGDRRRLPAAEMAERLRRLTVRAQGLRQRPTDIHGVRW
ncbi:MBL fold metallo-hydrolase [Streptacidiphilus sp. P02-A3a]|uniref:MBL fold metallo-hydrolase n=1 Tax=Streptacidiphilus sp. P02-A3a TaxID=2704468 RepID=UPI0015F983BD|nr:MBL fold metallo-hydrolase [Streptacidiphilus sp. P02-A3a]QMU69486.1 MBL fold metallo-hydrolase [Streptacidiphilus sp. P02-A3a]